jgi:radical SAM superfamily enzyme YgiQ (UPF0313 family)
MIGIPFEENKDLDSIIDFAMRVSESRRKANKSPAGVNISINTLIPKPHTPLQWCGMEGPEGIKDKQDYLKSKVRKCRRSRLDLNLHDPHMSFLEGILSRGDRLLSRVICGAFRRGAKFDAWSAHFSMEKWLSAFEEEGIDPNYYLRQRHRDEPLPWDFIDTGVGKEALKE